MNKQSHHKDEMSPIPTCENCIHTFRIKIGPHLVVCVQQLKMMPANNSQVCELYSIKKKNTLSTPFN
jgi:hypothetical protein